MLLAPLAVPLGYCLPTTSDLEMTVTNLRPWWLSSLSPESEVCQARRPKETVSKMSPAINGLAMLTAVTALGITAILSWSLLSHPLSPLLFSVDVQFSVKPWSYTNYIRTKRVHYAFSPDDDNKVRVRKQMSTHEDRHPGDSIFSEHSIFRSQGEGTYRRVPLRRSSPNSWFNSKRIRLELCILDRRWKSIIDPFASAKHGANALSFAVISAYGEDDALAMSENDPKMPLTLLYCWHSFLVCFCLMHVLQARRWGYS